MPSQSTLDPVHIIKTAYDDTTGAFKTIPASATSYEIELSAADGDNVTAKLDLLSVAGSVGTGSSGAVVAATACTGIRSFALYSTSDSAITGAPTLTIEVSPDDSGTNFVSTGVTLVPSGSSGVTVKSTIAVEVARRVRVTTSGATATGSATLKLVGHSA